jgi:hypothetical protein
MLHPNTVNAFNPMWHLANLKLTMIHWKMRTRCCAVILTTLKEREL